LKIPDRLFLIILHSDLSEREIDKMNRKTLILTPEWPFPAALGTLIPPEM
jgi:hypothetical protein